MPQPTVPTVRPHPAPAGARVREAGAEAETAELCAVLVIDASGNVVAANRSAAEILDVTTKALVGLACGEFLLPLASPGAAGAAANWKSFSAATLERWAVVSAQPPGAAARPLRVRLERAFGGAGTYIAVLRPALRNC